RSRNRIKALLILLVHSFARTNVVGRGKSMPGHELGYSIGLLVASGILSIAGIILALRMLPRETPAGGIAPVTIRTIPAGLMLTGTAWLLFVLALKLHFPRLDPDIPWPAM